MIVDLQPNDREGYTVAELDTHYVDICPMLFNHRVVLTPKACTQFHDVGWCYPSLLAAVAAVEVWDPETELEPVGYLKRVGEPLTLLISAG